MARMIRFTDAAGNVSEVKLKPGQLTIPAHAGAKMELVDQATGKVIQGARFKIKGRHVHIDQPDHGQQTVDAQYAAADDQAAGAAAGAGGSTGGAGAGSAAGAAAGAASGAAAGGLGLGTVALGAAGIGAAVAGVSAATGSSNPAAAAPAAPTITSTSLVRATTPTLAGTAAAGATVTVTVGGATYKVIATNQGAWTLNLATAAPVSGTLALNANGANTVTAVAALDNGPASSPASQTLTIDTTAPGAPTITVITDNVGSTTGPVAAGATTDDNNLGVTVGLTGTGAVAGDVVKLYRGSTQIGTATLTSADVTAGAVTIQTGTLADGSYSFNATITDAAGNVGSASAARAVTVDTAVSSSSSLITAHAATNSVTPTLLGNASAGQSVTVSVGGATYTVTADSQGVWSVNLATATPTSGTLTLDTTGTANTVSVTAGGVTATQSLVVDTVAPVAPAITGITDNVGGSTGTVTAGATTDDSDLSVAVSLTGTGAVVGDVVRLYQGTTQVGSATLTNANITAGTVSVQTGSLAGGSYNLTAAVTDAAGNTSATSVAQAVTISPPAGTPVMSSSTAVNSATPTLSGTATAGQSVTVTVGGATYTVTADSQGAWTLNLASATPTSGTLALDTTGAANPVTVTAGGITATQSLVVDTVAPTAPVIGAITDGSSTVTAGGTTSSSSVSVAVSLAGTGALIGDTVRLYQGGTQIGSATLTSANLTAGTVSISTGSLLNGSYSLSASVVDAAGNTSVTSTPQSVTVSAPTSGGSAPTAPSIGSITDNVGSSTGALTAGATTDDNDLAVAVTLTGTGAAAGDTVKLYDGSTLLGTVTLSSADITAHSVTVQTGALADGSHSLNATVTNGTGISAASVAQALTVNTAQNNSTPPSNATAPSISYAYDNVGASQGQVNGGGTTDDTDLGVIVGILNTGAVTGDVIKLYDGSTLLGTATVNPNDNFYTIQTGTLTAGAHSFTATITDSASHASTASSALALTVAPAQQGGGSAPTAPSIASVTDNVGSATGTLVSGAITDDPDLAVSVSLASTSAAAGDVITLYDGSTLLGTATLSAGDITANAVTIQTGMLATGNHSLNAKLTVGGVSSAASTSHAVLVAAPTAYSVGVRTSNSAPVIGGTAAAGTTLTIGAGGATYTTTADSNGGWSVNLRTATPTLGTLALNTNGANNVQVWDGTAATRQIVTIDSVAPSMPTVQLIDNVGSSTGVLSMGAMTDDSDLQIKVSLNSTGAAVGDVVRVSGNYGQGATASTFVQTATITQADLTAGFVSFQTGTISGFVSASASIVDAAGNAGGTSFTSANISAGTPAPSIQTVTANTGAQQGSITSNGSTSDNDLTVRVSLNGTGAVAGESIRLIGMGPLGTAAVLTATDITNGYVDVQTGPLGKGYNNLSAILVHADNTTSATSGTFMVNITSNVTQTVSSLVITDDVGAVTGTVTSNTTTDDNNLTVRANFTGTLVVGDSVRLFDVYSGAYLATQTVTSTDVTNGYVVMQTGTLTGAPRMVSAVYVNAAGEYGALAGNANFTVDATAPTAPTIAAVIDDTGSIAGGAIVAAGGSAADNDLTVRVSLANTGALAGNIVALADNGTATGTWARLTNADIANGYVGLQTGILSTGSHSLTANITDSVGNVGAASAAQTVTITTPGAVSTRVGSLSNSATPVLSGAGLANATITVAIGGATYTTIADGVGAWTVNLAAATPTSGTLVLNTNGTNLFTVSDGTTTSVQTLLLDTTGYNAVSITSVTDNVGASQGALAANATTDDNDLAVRISIVGTGASAGDVLRHGVSAGSPAWNYVTLTSTDIANGYVDVQTGTLTDGSKSYSAAVLDAAGNASVSTPTSSRSFTVNTATPAPAITSITDNVGSSTGALSSGATTDDTDLTVRVSLTGTGAVAGESVRLYNTYGSLSSNPATLSTTVLTSTDIQAGYIDVQTGTLTGGSSGTYYTVSARVVHSNSTTSNAGYFGNGSTGSPVRVYTPSPAPTITSASDNYGATQGIIATGSTSDDTTPSFTVSLAGTGAVAGETINISDGANVVVNYIISSADITAGSATVSVYSPQSIGSHSYTASLTHSTSSYLNSATSSAYAFSIGGAPTITSAALTNWSQPYIEGTSVVNNGPITITIGGATYTTTTGYNGSWTVYTSNTPSSGTLVLDVNGPNTVTVTDAGGTTTQTLVIDTTAPLAASITSLADNAGQMTGSGLDYLLTDDQTLTATINLTGTGAVAGDTVRLLVDSMTSSTYTLTQADITAHSVVMTTATVNAGLHSIGVKVIDAAGNFGALSNSPVFVTSLTSTTEVHIGGVYNGGSSTVIASGGTVTDTTPDIMVSLSGMAFGDAVRIFDGSTLLTTYYASSAEISAGSFTWTPTTALSSGTHNISVDYGTASDPNFHSVHSPNYTIII